MSGVKTASLVELEKSLLDPLKRLMHKLEDASMTLFGNTTKVATIEICAGVKIVAVFKYDGTAELIPMEGLDGITDTAGSWRHVAEQLLTLIDALGRTTTEQDHLQMTVVLTTLRAYAESL